MAIEFGLRQAEIAELPRQAPAAMIAGQEKTRGAAFMLDREGQRLVLGQELALKLHRWIILNR
jgi:hypothetical protein